MKTVKEFLEAGIGTTFCLENGIEVTGILSEERLQRNPTSDKYLYDIRHSDNDWVEPATIENGVVMVNWFVTLIVDAPIEFPEGVNFLEIEDYWKGKRICVLVRDDIDDATRQAIKDKTAQKLGSGYDVVVGTDKELNIKNGVKAQCVVIDDPMPTLAIRRRVYDNYTPIPFQSKKELRTSPYAKFDKFHKKKRR